MKVSVSILKEYDRLINAVKKVNDSSADFLHIDVMDGKFVDNNKFPLEVCKDIMSISNKKIDMHLMVENESTVLKYAKLLPEYLTFHVEILKDSKIIDSLKKLGIKVGLAINPETDIKVLLPYIKDIDLVLFMSVHPGLGGQEFITSTIDKIKELKKEINDDVIISIDGGVNSETIDMCRNSGCDMVVSGSYITNCLNYNQNIKTLR